MNILAAKFLTGGGKQKNNKFSFARLLTLAQALLPAELLASLSEINLVVNSGRTLAYVLDGEN